MGIEFQTLDTTGTVWPERQRLLQQLGVPRGDEAAASDRRFGVNWKHTAKTILMQLHHKVETFENVNRRLVLVLQDALLEYMETNFNFSHLEDPARLGDAMHFHGYSVGRRTDGRYGIELGRMVSTDAAGIASCLGLQAEARLELGAINSILEEKIGRETIFAPA